MHHGRSILSLNDFRVDYYQAQAPSGRLLFTFTEFSNRMLDGLGFAGKFAVENGFDLIAIKSSLDDWYQSLPPDTFDLIGNFLADLPERHSLRATYGSSMGGYAAILFASKVSANVAFALSPQFDIGQSWDQRWAKWARIHGPIQTLTREAVRPDCRYVLAYDPMDLDRLHIERFAEVISHDMLHTVKFPCAGHPVGYFLSFMKILKEFSLAVLSGYEIPLFRDTIRARKKAYSDYYFNLSRHCLKRRKLRWANCAISKAISLAPLNSEYRICAAQIAEGNGDLVGAISHAAFAVATAPWHPHMAATLSRLLQRMGLYGQALHYLDAASSLAPGAAFATQRAALERAMQRSTTAIG